MLTLYRTICSVDRKHRPWHRLALLMVSDSRETLIAKMDSDVADWQETDLEDGVTEWAVPNERWEMERNEGELRSFVLVEPEEDGSTTVAYHILES